MTFNRTSFFKKTISWLLVISFFIPNTSFAMLKRKTPEVEDATQKRSQEKGKLVRTLGVTQDVGVADPMDIDQTAADNPPATTADNLNHSDQPENQQTAHLVPKDASEKVNVLGLPDEVWGGIFNFCSEEQDRARLSAVCKGLRGIALDFSYINVQRVKVTGDQTRGLEQYIASRGTYLQRLSIPVEKPGLMSARVLQPTLSSLLQRLVLRRINFTQQPTLFATIFALPQLRELEVSKCNFLNSQALGSSQQTQVASLSTLTPPLIKLHWAWDDHGTNILFLGDLSRFTQLEYLNIEHPNELSGPYALLSSFDPLQNLNHLVCSIHQLNQTHTQSLSALPKLERVEVGDVEAKVPSHFYVVLKNPQLKVVNFRNGLHISRPKHLRKVSNFHGSVEGITLSDEKLKLSDLHHFFQHSGRGLKTLRFDEFWPEEDIKITAFQGVFLPSLERFIAYDTTCPAKNLFQPFR
jgi:hypothetical protein